MERISRAIGANHPKDAARYIGIPVMLQDGFIQVSFMIITIIANQRGLTDAAAVGIVEKIISFLFLVPSSLLSTVSALGAQNIGAGKHERVDAILRYAIGIGLGFGGRLAVFQRGLRRVLPLAQTPSEYAGIRIPELNLPQKKALLPRSKR